MKHNIYKNEQEYKLLSIIDSEIYTNELEWQKNHRNKNKSYQISTKLPRQTDKVSIIYAFQSGISSEESSQKIQYCES